MPILDVALSGFAALIALLAVTYVWLSRNSRTSEGQLKPLQQRTKNLEERLSQTPLAVQFFGNWLAITVSMSVAMLAVLVPPIYAKQTAQTSGLESQRALDAATNALILALDAQRRAIAAQPSTCAPVKRDFDPQARSKRTSAKK
jgi:hypothetical protein